MRAFINWASWVLEYLSIIFLAWIGWCLDFDIKEAESASLLSKAILETRAAGPILVIAAAISNFLFRFLSWRTQTKHTAQIALDRISTEVLDDFRKKVFPGVGSMKEPVHHNRVTLFKHFSTAVFLPRHAWKSTLWPWGFWRWPWSGWLVVSMRSGHVTQTATAIFLCPDDPENGEGVAGQAWSRGAYRVTGLPNFEYAEYPRYARWWMCWCMELMKFENSKVIAFRDFKERVTNYADSTNTSWYCVLKRIRSKKSCPNDILGVMIENSKGEPWGVLVMDSSNSIHCIDSNDSKFRSAFTTLTRKLRNMGAID